MQKLFFLILAILALGCSQSFAGCGWYHNGYFENQASTNMDIVVYADIAGCNGAGYFIIPPGASTWNSNLEDTDLAFCPDGATLCSDGAGNWRSPGAAYDVAGFWQTTRAWSVACPQGYSGTCIQFNYGNGWN